MHAAHDARGGLRDQRISAVFDLVELPRTGAVKGAIQGRVVGSPDTAAQTALERRDRDRRINPLNATPQERDRQEVTVWADTRTALDKRSARQAYGWRMSSGRPSALRASALRCAGAMRKSIWWPRSCGGASALSGKRMGRAGALGWSSALRGQARRGAGRPCRDRRSALVSARVYEDDDGVVPSRCADGQDCIESAARTPCDEEQPWGSPPGPTLFKQTGPRAA
jgi:hypothetical protein